MTEIDPRIAWRRENYPKKCAHCGGPLEGPGTDEEIAEQLAEHDKLFPGQSLTTSEVICDRCFQGICPGGNLISMD